MKRNILYIILNSTSLGIAVLVISTAVFAAVFCLAAGFPLARPAVIGLDRFLFFGAAVLSFCGMIFLIVAGFRRYGGGKLVCEAEKSRGQSFLLWETPAVLLFLLLFFLSWRTDLDWPLAVGLCLPIAALVLALAFPFPRCRNGFWTAVRVLGFASALSVFGLGGLFLVWSGRTVSYRGNDPAALPSGVRWLGGKYIPEGAAEIRLEGTSAVCRWSCRISEKDFRKFMDGQWPGNRFIRYDGPMNPEDKGPFPYYLNAVYRRDGGSYGLRYDIKNQTMTGWYSRH